MAEWLLERVYVIVASRVGVAPVRESDRLISDVHVLYVVVGESVSDISRDSDSVMESNMNSSYEILVERDLEAEVSHDTVTVPV